MKKTLVTATIAASAVIFTGCSTVSQADFDQLKAEVHQNQTTANQANQASREALQLSQQNASKIDRVFNKSQYK